MKGTVEGSTLAATGIGLAGIQVVQATRWTGTPLGFVIDAGPFALMGLAVAFAGFWLARHEEFRDHATFVVAWAVGGALGFAAVAALVLTSLNVAVGYPVLDSAAYLAMDQVTAGTLAGVLVGLYDARGRTQRAELQRQRDRVETFANRAADTNTYGRALNECATVEEVGGLCIEALATLVGLSDAAFVERRGGVATYVESTMVSVDDETVSALAARAEDGDRATVQCHDPPGDLPDDVESVLTMLVTETDEAAVTIVALDRGDGGLSEETSALLEMLVSHAGTALENVARTGMAGREPTSIDIDGEPDED